MITLNDEEIAMLLRNMMAGSEAQVRTLATLDASTGAEFSDQDTGESFAPETVERLWQAAREIEFTCYACQTRKPAKDWTRDSSGIDLCAECMEEAELENEHVDGYHETEKRADCLLCFPDTTVA